MISGLAHVQLNKPSTGGNTKVDGFFVVTP